MGASVAAPARGRSHRGQADPGEKQADSAVRSRRAPRSEAPLPIWAPLPITETLLAVGMLAIVAGLAVQRTALSLGGLAMVAIGSLELAVREHLAGYRSHTSLIATVLTAFITLGLAALLNATDVGLPLWPLLIVATATFVGLFLRLRRTFKRRRAGFGRCDT